jgi:phage terminase small subunit
MSSKLTNLQRKFVIHLVKPGTSQRKAYLMAGGKAKTENSQDSTSAEIMSNPKVRSFYDSLIQSSASSAILTREQALLILTRNASQAEEHRDQHQAIKQLSSMEGWDAPKKTELTGKDGGPIPITRIDRKIV